MIQDLLLETDFAGEPHVALVLFRLHAVDHLEELKERTEKTHFSSVGKVAVNAV